jgi:hypothetical protein
MTMNIHPHWLAVPVLLIQLLCAPMAFGTTEIVTVIGRAAIEPSGQDSAERLALEDALYMAAMAGGAELDGYSVVENGILVGESVTLRPSSRILDFNIVKTTVKSTHVEVQIQAYVGNSPKVMCNRQRELRLVTLASDISIANTLPASLSAVFHNAYEDVISSISMPGNISLQRRPNQTIEQARDANSVSSLDYQALMGGGGAAVAAEDHALQMDWKIVPANREGKVILTGELKLLSGSTLDPIKTIQLDQTISLRLANPLRTIEVLSRSSDAKLIEQVSTHLTPQISSLLDEFSCRPLITTLARGSERQLHVELGSRDGLQKSALAFVEDAKNPWAVLRIVELANASAILEPINMDRTAEEFDGLQVRFENGAK